MQLLAINWKYFLKIWIDRNSTEHGNKTKDQEEITIQKTIDEVEHIYNQNSDIINHSVASTKELHTINAYQLVTYLSNMKIIV